MAQGSNDLSTLPLNHHLFSGLLFLKLLRKCRQSCFYIVGKLVVCTFWFFLLCFSFYLAGLIDLGSWDEHCSSTLIFSTSPCFFVSSGSLLFWKWCVRTSLHRWRTDRRRPRTRRGRVELLFWTCTTAGFLLRAAVSSTAKEQNCHSFHQGNLGKENWRVGPVQWVMVSNGSHFGLPPSSMVSTEWLDWVVIPYELWRIGKGPADLCTCLAFRAYSVHLNTCFRIWGVTEVEENLPNLGWWIFYRKPGVKKKWSLALESNAVFWLRWRLFDILSGWASCFLDVVFNVGFVGDFCIWNDLCFCFSHADGRAPRSQRRSSVKFPHWHPTRERWVVSKCSCWHGTVRHNRWCVPILPSLF